jgi:hypothetical protein
MAPPVKDITGVVFGKLTALKFVGYRQALGGERHREWLCRCECGTEVLIAQRHLRGGNTKSCGCWLTVRNKLRATHNASKTPEFKTWVAMRHRCEYPRNKMYQDYGGRGIRVCDRWQSFDAFLADMGPRPSPEHSLDRIDNDGNYEPENCRWTTSLVQANNKRNNIRVTFNGETRTVGEWGQRIGVAGDTIKKRIRAGWPLEEALTRGYSRGIRSLRGTA